MPYRELGEIPPGDPPWQKPSKVYCVNCRHFLPRSNDASSRDPQFLYDMCGSPQRKTVDRYDGPRKEDVKCERQNAYCNCSWFERKIQTVPPETRGKHTIEHKLRNAIAALAAVLVLGTLLWLLSGCSSADFDPCDYVGDTCAIWVGVDEPGTEDGYGFGICAMDKKDDGLRCLLRCVEGKCYTGTTGAEYHEPTLLANGCYCVSPYTEL